MNTNNQYQQTRSQSDSRGERGSHVSRAIHRGAWRKPSRSVDKRRATGATTGTSEVGKPKEYRNRPAGDNNRMTFDKNRNGTSKSVSKSPHGAKNRQCNVNNVASEQIR